MGVEVVVRTVLARQVRDLSGAVWPRDVVVEVAPSRRHGASRGAAGAVDGLHVGPHRRSRSVGRGLEVERGPGLGIDHEVAPGRVVIEHDLAGLVGCDPSVPLHLARCVGEADRRRQRHDERDDGGGPAADARETLIASTAYVIRSSRRPVLSPRGLPAAARATEHQGVRDDVGAQGVEVARVPGRTRRPSTGIRPLHGRDDLVDVIDDGEHAKAVAVDLRVRAPTAPGRASPLAGLAVGRQAGTGQPLSKEGGGGRRTVLRSEDGIDEAVSALGRQCRDLPLDRAGAVERDRAPLKATAQRDRTGRGRRRRATGVASW